MLTLGKMCHMQPSARVALGSPQRSLDCVLTSHGVVSSALPLDGAIHFGERGPFGLPPLPRPRGFTAFFSRFSGLSHLFKGSKIRRGKRAAALTLAASSGVRSLPLVFHSHIISQVPGNYE